MPADDQPIKTTLRLPRDLHATITRAAESAGISFNAEVALRLKHDPHVDATRSILEEVKARDTQLAEFLLKQNGILWRGLDRAGSILDRVASALSKAPEESEAGALRREIEIARELIGVIKDHSR